MEIVSVRFQNKLHEGEFSGREYSYLTNIPLKVGDIVIVPTRNGSGIAEVSQVNVSSLNVGCPVEKLKTIETLAGSKTPAADSKPASVVVDAGEACNQVAAEQVPAVDGGCKMNKSGD